MGFVIPLINPIYIIVSYFCFFVHLLLTNDFNFAQLHFTFFTAFGIDFLLSMQ